MYWGIRGTRPGAFPKRETCNSRALLILLAEAPYTFVTGSWQRPDLIPPACATSFIWSTNTVSLSRRDRMRARRSGRGHFARQAHSGRTSEGRRILSFQRRVYSSDCCSRSIIQSRPKRGGPRRDDLNAAPRDAGQPISCPCSLQRIPDVRTGKVPLRSLPRVGRHPAIPAACRARLISDWKTIICHGSFVKRGRSETLPHRVHRARDRVDDRFR
jgi:hypothetical protein